MQPIDLPHRIQPIKQIGTHQARQRLVPVSIRWLRSFRGCASMDQLPRDWTAQREAQQPGELLALLRKRLPTSQQRGHHTLLCKQIRVRSLECGGLQVRPRQIPAQRRHAQGRNQPQAAG